MSTPSPASTVPKLVRLGLSNLARSKAYDSTVHRIGLVGCGEWGSLLRNRLEALGAEVIVVDPAVDGRPLSNAHPGPVDGFVVATPASTHAVVLDQLLELPSVPVFCEKPFTTDAADAARLAEAYGERLHLMHVWRYHQGVERLAEIAQSGAIGDITGIRSTRANWTSPRTDVDVAWTLLPHDLTIAIAILGDIPTPRHARAELVAGRAVSLWADLGGHEEPWLLIEVSNRYADKRREVRVHGTQGVAVLPGLDADAIEISFGDPLRTERATFAGDEPVVSELADFLAHIDGGPAPRCSAEEGVAVVQTVEELRLLAGLPAPY